MSDQPVVVNLGLPFTPQKLTVRPFIPQSPAYPASEEGSISLLDESTDHIFESPIINRSASSRFNDSSSSSRYHHPIHLLNPTFIDEGVDVSIRDDNHDHDEDIHYPEQSVAHSNNQSFQTLNEDEVYRNLGSFDEEIRSIDQEQDNEIERLKTTLNQFHQERARVADEQSHQQCELVETHNRIKELEVELEIQQQETTELRSDHQIQIDALNQTIATQAEQISSQQRNLSDLQALVDNLKQSNELHAKQLAEVRAEKIMLTEKLRSQTQEHEQTENSRSKDLNQEHDSQLREMQDKHQNSIKQLINEHQQQLHAVDENHQKCMATVRHNESLQQESIAALTVDVSNLKAEVLSNVESLNTHQQMSDKYQKHIHEQQKLIANQEEVIAELKISIKRQIDHQSTHHEQQLVELRVENDQKLASLITEHETNVRAIVSRHEKQQKELQNELEEARTAEATLAARNQELHAQHEVFRQNIATAHPNSVDAVEERRARHEIERHEMARRGLERECVALKKRLQAKIDECSSLTAMCDEKVERSQYDELVERLRDLEQERKQLLDTSKSTHIDVKTLRNELDEERQAVAISSKERSQLKLALDSAMSQIEMKSVALVDCRAQHEEILESMRKSLMEERTHNQRLSFALDESESNLFQWKEKVVALENQLTERDDTIKHLQQQVEGYSSSSEDESMTRQQRYCKAKHTIKSAYETLVSAENQVSTLRTDNAAMQQALEQRDAAIAALQTDIADVMAGRRRARHAAKQLKARCEKLRVQLASCESKLHDEKENCHSVNTKLVRRLKNEIMSLRQAYSTLSINIPQMLKDFSQTVIVDVVRRVESLQLELDDANNDRLALTAAMNALQARMSWRYESLLQAHERHHRQYATLLKAQEQMNGTRASTGEIETTYVQSQTGKQHRRSSSTPRDS